MATSSSPTSSIETATAAWERFYHLLSRGYAHIAQHPSVEAEILGTFMSMNTSFIEGTALEREYKSFPRVFVKFLEAYRLNQETVTLALMAEARYQDQSEHLKWIYLLAENQKKLVEFTNDQVSLLLNERARLVDRLAMFQAWYEFDSSDVLTKAKCDWLEKRVENLAIDIAFEKALGKGLELAVEHYNASVAKLKEECRHLFFRLVELEPQSAECRHTINYLENQLSSFVMLIRTQFGFTFPSQ